MSDTEVIPSSYEAWRNCITIRCGIKLTESYIESRLLELEQTDHSKTQEFERLYGSDHLQRTISWFRRASEELAGKTGSRRRA